MNGKSGPLLFHKAMDHPLRDEQFQRQKTICFAFEIIRAEA